MAASDAEMRLLGELRAKELKDLSDSDFAIVERDVKAFGFKNLKGSSAQIVFNAIRKRDKAMKDMKKHGNHDQSTHGSWSGNPSNGDDPAAMDMMNDKPYKLPKLTPAQRKIYNRVASPASSAYVERPFGGIEFARTWRTSGQPQITGYKPDPANNPS